MVALSSSLSNNSKISVPSILSFVHFFSMEFEIFLFLGITSDFLLHLDIFRIMLHNSGSYLNFLFQLASYDVSLTGETEALPHYCQVRVEIQCPHSTPFDPWWGELPVLLGKSKSVSYTVGLHS